MGSEIREGAPGDGLEEDAAHGGGVCAEGHHPDLWMQEAVPRPGRASAQRLDVGALEQEFEP